MTDLAVGDLEYWRERALCVEEELGSALTRNAELVYEITSLRRVVYSGHLKVVDVLATLHEIRHDMGEVLGDEREE